jgi:hypothetical protein
MGAPGGSSDAYRIMTPDEATARGLDAGIKFQINTKSGQITAIPGQSKAQLKPWPAPALEAHSTNQASLTNIDKALALLDPKNNSEAARNARNGIGVGTGALGDTFTQLHDPKGADFRAQLGQIGGVIIKDISGAAVSASEDDRLKKWIPRVNDTPATAISKLRNLKREIMQRNQAMDATYNEDQGYRSFGDKSSSAARSRSARFRRQ